MVPRAWKIVLAVVGIWVALAVVGFALWNAGETVPDSGEGDPLTELRTTP